MKKRIVSVFMVLFIALSFVSISGVSAAEPPIFLRVAGVEVTEKNAYDVLGDGTISFDFKTRTLTLDNAKISLDTPSDMFGYGIFTNSDLKISLIGKNNITVSDGYDSSYGIDVSGGNLTICEAENNSTLIIRCGNTESESIGIHVATAYSGKGGILSVKSGDVNVSSGDAPYSYGIHVSGELNATGGKLVSYAGDGYDSVGIFTSDCSLVDEKNSFYVKESGHIFVSSDAYVSAYGGDSSNGPSYGIRSYGNLTVTSGELKAVGGIAETSYGIYTNENLYFSGGVTTASSVGNWDNFGIYADESTYGIDKHGGYIYVNNNAVVTATNHSEDFFEFEGMYAAHDIEVLSGNVTVKSSTFVSGSFYYGIYTWDGLIVRGGKVVVSLPDGYTDKSSVYCKAISAISGIKLSKDITISGIFGDYDAGDMHYTYDDVDVPVVIEPLPDLVCHLGDSDRDSAVNVKDATLIQKYLVNLEKLSDIQLFCADANEDGVVNIRDATMIQKYAASIKVDHPVGSQVKYK